MWSASSSFLEFPLMGMDQLTNIETLLNVEKTLCGHAGEFFLRLVNSLHDALFRRLQRLIKIFFG